MPGSLPRRALAEFIGTGFLVASVIGSGIAASRLSPSDTGLQLFENAIATGAALVALILAFGDVSGAHFNPIVSLLDRLYGGLSTRDTGTYVVAQGAGAAFGAMIANLMFGLPAVNLSTKVRSGSGLWLGEIVATFGLALVIFGVVRSGRNVAAFAVGAYIAAAYFFTSSTSFANPAVTLARTLSDTFAGISPSSVPAFVIFELLGGAIAAAAIWILYPRPEEAARELIPHEREVDR